MNFSTSAVRDMAEGSKNRTSWIKGLFRAAFKIVTRRDDDAPRPQKRRRRGEKEGSGPIPMRQVGVPAARGRYAGLQAGFAAAKSAGAGVGHEAQAMLYLADTLEWLELWDGNTAHWPDDDFSARKEQYFPQP